MSAAQSHANHVFFRVCAALVFSPKLLPLLREATAYVLMRPFLDDVAASDFCGAVPGRSQELLPEFHDRLVDALVPIPAMEPGDMVFWHPDLIHAVQVLHQVVAWRIIAAVSNCQHSCSSGCRSDRRITMAQRTAPSFTFP